MRRCNVCRTVRFSATVAPEEIYQDGYHDGSIDFGWDYAKDAAYERETARRKLEWLEERVAKGTLVDIGGGLGYFAAVAAERGWDATLVEPVAAAAEHARTTFGIRALQEGVEDLPGRGERFDVVTLNHAIEHFPDALGTLRQLRGILAEGGVLYVEVPNLGSLGRRLLGDRWMGWQAGEHVYVFSKRTLVGLVERAGYEIVTAGTFVPGWHGLLPDAYGHLLGVEGLMHLAVDARRNLRRRRAVAAGDAGEGSFAASENVPIAQNEGVRKLVYTRGFDLLADVEAATGLGTNIRVLARPRG
jgi:SAM-dependent methyltransferase